MLMRWHIISHLLKHTEKRRFLEIGVQHGICGSRVVAAEKWGVDPEFTSRAKPHYNYLFRRTSDSFFEHIDPAARYDVIMVDGLHHADQTLRDVDNALRHLSDDGWIVMHDCNPLTEIAQRVPRETGVWNGDCWKAMARLRGRSDVQAFTVNTDHGVGIVRRGPNPHPIEVPATLDYDTLDANRSKLLGLVEPEAWDGRLWSRDRIAVVTAIFGGRDAPLPVKPLDTDAQIMFTDGPGAAGWMVERMSAGDDPRATARKVKATALEMVDADIVVWVDGRVALKGQPLRPLITRALESADIAAYQHPWRDCLYDEARACAELGRAPVDAIEKQIAAYTAAGMPPHAGLWNTMVTARRRTPEMVDFGRRWWAEMQRHTLRDQVSLPYLLWRDGIRCGSLGADVYRPGSSRHFNRGVHAEANP